MKSIFYRFNATRNLFKWLKATRNDSDRFLEIFNRDLGDVEKLIGPLPGKRVLEIGCGIHYPHVNLFHDLGCDVTGIDLRVISPKEGLRGYIKFAKENGRKAGLKAFIYHHLIYSKLRKDIRNKMGTKKRPGCVDVRVMDAGNMDFPDNTFDLIYSCAVLEHVSDLKSVLSETKRVLKPGAVAIFGIHLFASLSGGHNPTARDPKTGNQIVPPPWDHLRENLFPTGLYLNKLRESDFKAAFEEQGFEFIEWRRVQASQETVEKLTPELEEELEKAGYTREELLTDGVTAYVKKPQI